MNIINIPGWQVVTVKETGHDYMVSATYNKEPECCVKCGSTKGLYGHGRRSQKVMDIPSHGKRMGIEIDRKRYRCMDCGGTFLQPVEGIHTSGSMTDRLVRYIEQQSLTRTFADMAHEIGVDEKTIRNIFNAYVERLDFSVKFETPRYLGIDEVHLMGHARCVFTDIKQPALIGMLEGRNKPEVVKFLSTLDKDRVKVVTIDMWRAYRDAANAILPGAAVVVDKFHVVRLASQAVETIRRGLREDMNTGQRRKLMRSRYLLLRRDRELTPEQKIERDDWAKSLPTIHDVYWLKEWFYDVWDNKSRSAAEKAYDEWLTVLPANLRPAFKDLTTAMTNWREEIFAYFDHGVTNAATEALNGLVKIANRTGRGYSFKALRAKMLYGRKVQKGKHGGRVEIEMIAPPDTHRIKVQCSTLEEMSAVLNVMADHLLKEDGSTS